MRPLSISHSHALLNALLLLSSCEFLPGCPTAAAFAQSDREMSGGRGNNESRGEHATQAGSNQKYPDGLANERRLAAVGIQRYESTHLILYTDIDPEIAGQLGGIADAAWPHWQQYFGRLTVDTDDAPLRFTGFIMKNKPQFRQLGLLPEDLPDFDHGRHLNNRFWMNDQPSDYYRRHLMLHEATHCYMTARSDSIDAPPVWYMEGMAELFATHRTRTDGTLEFGVMPHDRASYEGLSRIAVVRKRARDGSLLPLDRLLTMSGHDFRHVEHYSAAWAFCILLEQHPNYRDRFRSLARQVTARSFTAEFDRLFRADSAAILTQWLVYSRELIEGYDIPRAAMTLVEGRSLDPDSTETVSVRADRGWQKTGIILNAGVEYQVDAAGRFTLANQPRPWVSDSAGISFRYIEGRRIGMLQAAVLTTGDAGGRWEVFSVGNSSRLKCERTGSLYFRLNDSPAELADNRGMVSVIVTRPMQREREGQPE